MRNAKDLVGICVCCKEWTSVHEACCNRSVFVEGSTIDPGDFCETCGDELNRDAECDRCENTTPEGPSACVATAAARAAVCDKIFSARLLLTEAMGAGADVLSAGDAEKLAECERAMNRVIEVLSSPAPITVLP